MLEPSSQPHGQPQNDNLQANSMGAQTGTSIPSPFEQIGPAAADPILGLKQKFLADPNPNKVDLGAGVYQNELGYTSVMEVVREAEAKIAERRAAVAGKTDNSADYLPIDGLKSYNTHVQSLLFGPDSLAVKEGRVVTVQSIGGTGALRNGADFLKRYFPGSTVYVSDPTWANHRGIFERAGLKVDTYPYYSAATNTVAFDDLVAKIGAMPEKSIVLLHACCHNPTGLDFSQDQWRSLAELFKRTGHIPFIDFAYQGFAKGLNEDAFAVRLFADEGLRFFVANSFSKSFSLYNRRIGALSIATGSKTESDNVLSQLKTDIRTNSSNPPKDGAEIVDLILSDPILRPKWEAELASMRDRIKDMRQKFVAALKDRGFGERFDHLLGQNGMFSYSGIDKQTVQKLRDEQSLYMVDSGRICVASMTDKNLPAIVDAIAKALGQGGEAPAPGSK